LIVPEFMLAECANIVWKKSALLGELTEAESKTIIEAVQELLVDALRIALETKRSVYDSLYVALAVSQDCQLMTDDRKLFQSLQSTSLAAFPSLIENY